MNERKIRQTIVEIFFEKNERIFRERFAFSLEYFLFNDSLEKISSNKSLIINGEDNLRISFFKYFPKGEKTRNEKHSLPGE